MDFMIEVIKYGSAAGVLVAFVIIPFMAIKHSIKAQLEFEDSGIKPKAGHTR